MSLCDWTGNEPVVAYRQQPVEVEDYESSIIFLFCRKGKDTQRNMTAFLRSTHAQI